MTIQRVNMDLNRDLWKRVGIRAIEEGINKKDLVEKALENYLKGESEVTLNILKNKEYGDLTVAYAGIDLKDYEYITVDEFIEIVEESDFWDSIEVEIYQKALEDVGLDYSDYDDPDVMWDDFLKAVNK